MIFRDLKVEYIPIKEIKPYSRNAKKHPAEQVEQIANSIRLFGFNDPLAIDENGTIIEGHGRLLAVKELIKTGEYDRDTLPVIRLDGLDEQQRKAYIIAHNKLTINSDFDIDILNDELRSIDEIDMGDLGFSTAELNQEEPDPTDDNYDEPIPAVSRSKLGYIYQLGDHRLMCGDSTKAEDVERLMNGEKADLLLTDPPYNVSLGQNGGHPISPSEAKQLHRRTDGLIIANDEMNDAQFREFLRSALDNAITAMREGASYYIWHADTKGRVFRDITEDAGLQIRQTLIWAKHTFAMGRQDYQWKHEPCLYGWKDGAAHYFTERRNEVTVYEEHPEEIAKLSKEQMKELLLYIFNEQETPTTIMHEDKPMASDLHPTMKPIPLFGRLIKNSTKEGDLVLDLFAGSGTTAIAAEQLGRRAYMMEYDPRYVDVIIDRWEKYTGRTAELIET